MNWHSKVRHVMSEDPVHVDINDKPSAIQSTLQRHGFHHLPVLDKGTLVGVVSTVDLARVSLSAWVNDAETEKAWMDTQFQIKDIMTWEPTYVEEGDSVRAAADKLSSGSFHSLPVLDAAGQLVGMLTSTDLLRFIASA